MPTRQVYLEELAKLKSDVIKMGSLLEDALCEVIDALENLDVAKAKKIISEDDRIDEMERIIEDECVNLIAKQQPVATDLRQIASVMRIIADLERMADHCSDIAELIIEISADHLPLPEHVHDVVDTVRTMVSQVIEAYIREDLNKAAMVIDADLQVDEYAEGIREEIYIAMKHNVDKIRPYGQYLMINNHLERLADHCTNIAEWVRFIVTGELTI